EIADETVDAGHVAARAVETGDEAQSHRITARVHHDWNRRGCGLCGQDRTLAPGGDDDGDATAHEVFGQPSQPFRVAVGPLKFDRDIAPLRIPYAGEALPERAQHGYLDRLRAAAQITDFRCACLLRVRDPVAGKRRATDKRNEFAPSHLTLKPLLDSGGRYH